MDFSTVRKKLANGSYSTLEELEVCDKFVSLILHDELILYLFSILLLCRIMDL